MCSFQDSLVQNLCLQVLPDPPASRCPPPPRCQQPSGVRVLCYHLFSSALYSGVFLRNAMVPVASGCIKWPVHSDGGMAETGREAVTQAFAGPLQLGTAAEASCPRYQWRAGLRFSRSCNLASTAGLFFDKQDASI